MSKNLAVMVAALILGAVAASATVTVIEVVNKPYSPGSHPALTPALWVTGNWDVGPAQPPGWSADNYSVAPDRPWLWQLDGSVKRVGAVDLYVLSALGKHNVGDPANWFGGTMGVPNFAGLGGLIISTLYHPPGPCGDNWLLTACIDPAGTMNFSLYAAHMFEPVPEPGSFALIAGLGLVGFAACRRVRA